MEMALNQEGKIKVLFVCMGNICRSPTAEGVFRNLVRTEGLDGVIETDSAGTHSFHIGKKPDSRARAAALRRGIDISDLRARQVTSHDFDYFDRILAMDESNLALLMGDCPSVHREKIDLFLRCAPRLSEKEVPDPYFGGDDGFEYVLDLIEAASRGLLEDVRRRIRSDA